MELKESVGTNFKNIFKKLNPIDTLISLIYDSVQKLVVRYSNFTSRSTFKEPNF